jgi:threonine/homoserine/homoserine lactone efflux protein
LKPEKKDNCIGPLLSGILTGLFLQLAVGPVFFFVLQITIEGSFLDGLCAIAAVTIVDYLYICLSLLGLGKVLEKRRVKRAFGILGSLLLAVFGVLILKGGIEGMGAASGARPEFWTPWRSFAACFALTISSPLTIVFWSSVFATKAIEAGYEKARLTLFGLGAGAATFLFLTATMFALSLVGGSIPSAAIRWLNAAVGVVLIGYAVKRSIAVFREGKAERLRRRVRTLADLGEEGVEEVEGEAGVVTAASRAKLRERIGEEVSR